ncbi:MAG: hypothetical protein GY811_28965 [Myxococcales bacterium]|nr:hypothetical protein [Myxococcales bacterium]
MEFDSQPANDAARKHINDKGNAVITLPTSDFRLLHAYPQTAFVVQRSDEPQQLLTL